MPKQADIGSKKLANVNLSGWVNWLLQRDDVEALELLSEEFQWIGRETDLLIRSYTPEHGAFLTLNELQLRPTLRTPRRVNAYASLAEEKYGLPVYPVVLNILPHSEPAAAIDYYESFFMGLYARREYRVINLWEIDAEYAFDPDKASLLPFVPVMRGGDNVETVRRAVLALRANEQLQDFEPLLAFFASFVLGSEIVQEIMRWEMVVVEESPWYQEIIAKGIERGREEGRQNERRAMVQRILETRFGPLAAEAAKQVQTLDVNQLEAAVDSALTSPSLEAVLAQFHDWTVGSA